MLLEGLAYLFRQLWVVRTEALARHRRSPPSAWIGSLTLAILLDWLAQELADHYPKNRTISLDPAGYTT